MVSSTEDGCFCEELEVGGGPSDGLGDGLTAALELVGPFGGAVVVFPAGANVKINDFKKYYRCVIHSLIRGVLIQSCSAGAENFTNYVFCHPQFNDVIQNIENHCAILTPICLCRLLSK